MSSPRPHADTDDVESWSSRPNGTVAQRWLLAYLQWRGKETPVGLRLRSRDYTRLDTALQAVIPIGTFGAALAFGTLYSAERTSPSGSRTVRALAWAFALYLCAAILSLNTRLGVNVDPHNQAGVLGTQMRQTAFVLSVLACLSGTMLMAVSLTSDAHENGVRAAGVVATVVVGYAGLLMVEHAALYALRDDAHQMHLDLLSLLRSQQAEECFLQSFQPPASVRDEIDRFLHLYSRYGRAFAYLTSVSPSSFKGGDSIDDTSFEGFSLEEQARRLAYATMVLLINRALRKILICTPQALDRIVRFPSTNLLSSHLLYGAREFLAAPMRKWDPVIKQLAEQDGGEDSWWQISRPAQVLRMWWLHEVRSDMPGFGVLSKLWQATHRENEAPEQA